jgi:hypothetical protein
VPWNEPHVSSDHLGGDLMRHGEAGKLKAGELAADWYENDFDLVMVHVDMDTYLKMRPDCECEALCVCGEEELANLDEIEH